MAGFHRLVGALAIVLVCGISAAAEPGSLVRPKTAAWLEQVLQAKGHLTFLPDPRMDKPGFERGLVATDEAGTSWTLTLMLDGELTFLIANTANNRCSERYRQPDDPPFKPESDEATIRAIATSFRDAVTTRTQAMAFERCTFWGENRWTVSWKRQEAGVPYANDGVSMEICDRDRAVLLYGNGLRSAPPIERPSALAQPMTPPPEAAKARILEVANATGWCRRGDCNEVDFEEGKWQIVTPNGLFNGTSYEEACEIINDRCWDKPTTYARVYRFKFKSPRDHAWYTGEIWIGADDRILGGDFMLGVIMIPPESPKRPAPDSD